jgi:hypothetical protein
MRTPTYKIVETELYDIKKALYKLLSSPVSKEILLEIEKEDKMPIEIKEKRTALRDIVEGVIGYKAKELMKLAPEYSKAVIIELNRQVERELDNIESIYDMENNTNGRGELCLIGNTQKIYDKIDKELDKLIIKMTDGQITDLYKAVKEGLPILFLVA